MEVENNIISLWHGGRDLHLSYHKPKVCAKGRWEHGPGLYLTTHYETARKYAKGGGATYKVELELGNHIKNIDLHIDNILDFVKRSVIKSKQNDIIDDLHNHMKRTQKTPFINAEVLVNLCVNYEALKGEQTIALNRFLVENKVDYGTESNFGGRDETVCIVYNLDKIKKVKAIKSKDVPVSDYELYFPTINKKNKINP
jgi:hypothetical protein